MIEITFSSEELAQVRFAHSPMLELTISRRLLHVNKHIPGFTRWIDESRRELHGVELPYFDALLTQMRHIPDFITPTPDTVETNIEDQFAVLRATDHTFIHEHLSGWLQDYPVADSEVINHFFSDTAGAIECLIQEMRLYWERALGRHWPNIKRVLDTELLYRARQMALSGASATINDLHPKYVYENGRITIYKHHPHIRQQAHVTLGGQGLRLVPLIFARPPHWQLESIYPPMLMYGARGAGNWYAPPEDPHPAIEVLLGAGRASVLQSLVTPSNTGEIARQLHLTAGAVSQHLSKLREAGLVEPERSGKRVFYHLTERGEQFLTLFAS